MPNHTKATATRAPLPSPNQTGSAPPIGDTGLGGNPTTHVPGHDYFFRKGMIAMIENTASSTDPEAIKEYAILQHKHAAATLEQLIRR